MTDKDWQIIESIDWIHQAKLDFKPIKNPELRLTDQLFMNCFVIDLEATSHQTTDKPLSESLSNTEYHLEFL